MKYNPGDVSLTVGGIPIEGISEMSVEPKMIIKRADYRAEVKRFTAYVETTLRRTFADIDRFIAAFTPPKPKGATNETLAKRVRYGGRKGRRAHRRLRKLGLMPMHVHMPDGEIVSYAVKPEDIAVTISMRHDYVEHIAKNALRHCGSTPCPKCGFTSPCCDHDEVDIGVGVQTGNHEYVCREHGPFAYSSHDGEPIFRDDAS